MRIHTKNNRLFYRSQEIADKTDKQLKNSGFYYKLAKLQINSSNSNEVLQRLWKLYYCKKFKDLRNEKKEQHLNIAIQSGQLTIIQKETTKMDDLIGTPSTSFDSCSTEEEQKTMAEVSLFLKELRFETDENI
jgi:hypothetical protein